MLGSVAISGPLVTRARRRGDPPGEPVVDTKRSGLLALLSQPSVATEPAEQLRLGLALGNQIATQFIAPKLHLDYPVFKLLATARSSLSKMLPMSMVITDAGEISKRDRTFDIDEHIPGFCQELAEGKFDRNWYGVLVVIAKHRKSPVPPVGKAEQWPQPRSAELATIAGKILGAVGFVALPASHDLFLEPLRLLLALDVALGAGLKYEARVLRRPGRALGV